VFGGLAFFVALHFLVEVENGFVARIASIILLLTIAISRKTWLIYLMLLVRFYQWFM